MIQYLGHRAAAAVAPLVPAGTGYRASARIADALVRHHPRLRRLLTGNLRAVVPPRTGDERIAELARLAARNLVWNYYELFRFAGVGLDDVREHGTIEGVELLRQAAAESDTGAIIAFGHVGNIEAFSQATQLFPDLRFLVVVERMADPKVFDLLQRMRRRQGLELVPTDEPRRLVSMLRDGWHTILAADFDSTGRGIVVDFFGRPARLPTGAVKLALRTGAPLFMAEVWRQDMDRPHAFHARLAERLVLTGSAERAEDVRAGVEQVARVLERQISTRPEQWLATRCIWEDAA